MQSLFKRFYDNFVYGLIDSVHLFRNAKKGIFIKANDNCVRVLDGSKLPLEWVEVPVFEAGDLLNKQERWEYFNETKVYPPVKFASKIVQVNATDIYIVGGGPPSLLSREYRVASSCLTVNIETGELA